MKSGPLLPFVLTCPGALPAAAIPCTAHAVDWGLGSAFSVSDQPPLACCARRSHWAPSSIFLPPSGETLKACSTAPVLSGSLSAPLTDPQPPFLFWMSTSHSAGRLTLEPSTPAARWARIANAVRLTCCSKDPLPFWCLRSSATRSRPSHERESRPAASRPRIVRSRSAVEVISDSCWRRYSI